MECTGTSGVTVLPVASIFKHLIGILIIITSMSAYPWTIPPLAEQRSLIGIAGTALQVLPQTRIYCPKNYSHILNAHLNKSTTNPRSMIFSSGTMPLRCQIRINSGTNRLGDCRGWQHCLIPLHNRYTPGGSFDPPGLFSQIDILYPNKTFSIDNPFPFDYNGIWKIPTCGHFRICKSKDGNTVF